MILYKCIATAIGAMMAFAGVIHAGDNPLLSLPFWASVCCVLGDGLLEIRFLLGMAAFGAAHMVLIAWISVLFAISGNGILLAAGLWLMMWTGSVWMFRKYLKALGRRKPAFLLYAAVLMAMAAMAVLLPLTFGWKVWNVALGGILFAVSDLFVAKGLFDRLSPAWDRFALLIYYAAVYLLSISTWML